MKIVKITQKNRTKVDKMFDSSYPILILYRMEGCGHCVRLKPVWEEATKILETNPNIYIAEVEVNDMTVLPDNLQDNKFFPTIKIVQNKAKKADFLADRTKKENIVKFALDNIDEDKVKDSSSSSSVKKPKKTIKK